MSRDRGSTPPPPLFVLVARPWNPSADHLFDRTLRPCEGFTLLQPFLVLSWLLCCCWRSPPSWSKASESHPLGLPSFLSRGCSIGQTAQTPAPIRCGLGKVTFAPSHSVPTRCLERLYVTTWSFMGSLGLSFGFPGRNGSNFNHSLRRPPPKYHMKRAPPSQRCLSLVLGGGYYP